MNQKNRTMKTNARIFLPVLMGVLLFAMPQAGRAQNCLASYTFTITGSTVYFTSTSTGVSGNATYFWDFGDFNTGVGQTISYVYSQPNTYYVCLTVMDSTCNNQFCDSVVLPPNCPPAGFTYFATGNTASFAENVNGISPNSTWFWTFGDGNFSTQQNPTHNYFSAGTYNVCVSYYDPVAQCQDSSCMPVTVGPTAIPEQFVPGDFSVYPNPFTDQLTVSFAEATPGPVRISLTDLTGRLLLEQNTTVASGTIRLFETAALRPGMYMLRVSSENGTVSKRIIRH